jgi:endonuclease YncB( thermonuclease family)
MRIVCALFCSVFAAQSAAARDMVAVPEIVDADTIYAGAVKIRLAGLDAPETDQVCIDSQGRSWPCGLEARKRLQSFSGGRTWLCRLTGEVTYDRQVGSCTIDGEDVGRWLVREGWALAFKRYSQMYVRDEIFARKRQKGLWSGAFVAPWDWRHRSHETLVLGAFFVQNDAQRKLIAPELASMPPDPACAIKANLRTDQCIYHVPGGRFYDRLDMTSKSSRRWFCSEVEARAAGCRKSKL